MNNDNFRDRLPRFFPWAPAFLLAIGLIVLPAAFCAKQPESPVEKTSKKSSSRRSFSRGSKKYSAKKRGKKNQVKASPSPDADRALEAES